MLRRLKSYPFLFCSCLVITKMVERVLILCLDLFQHLWVRHKAYGMDRQLGAASVQTVDWFFSLVTERIKQVPLSCFHLFQHCYAQKLSGVDRRWGATAEYSGQRGPYWTSWNLWTELLSASTLSLVSFAFAVVWFCVNVRINVTFCVYLYSNVLLCRLCT